MHRETMRGDDRILGKVVCLAGLVLAAAGPFGCSGTIEDVGPGQAGARGGGGGVPPGTLPEVKGDDGKPCTTDT